MRRAYIRFAAVFSAALLTLLCACQSRPDEKAPPCTVSFSADGGREDTVKEITVDGAAVSGKGTSVPKGGKITVCVTAAEGRQIISVNGAAIQPAAQHTFTLDVKADTTAVIYTAEIKTPEPGPEPMALVFAVPDGTAVLVDGNKVSGTYYGDRGAQVNVLLVPPSGQKIAYVRGEKITAADDGTYSFDITLSNQITVTAVTEIMEKEKRPISLAGVSFVKWVTGRHSPTNTLKNWNIGGTDLGIPYYDSVRGKMYVMFGDTFSDINSTTGNWRSQSFGVTTDFDLSDGLTFDEFLHDAPGFAKQVIPARHMSDYDRGEVTCIPTGAIAINGKHYVWYMSVENWLNHTWQVNFCNVAVSEDGQNFVKSDKLIWCNSGDIARANARITLNVSEEYLESRIAPDFMQMFPYLNKRDGYIYLFGLTSGRRNGVKLARVLPENIEVQESYEYLQADKTWVKGAAGLAGIRDNKESYIVDAATGELSVAYNAYLDRYMMGYYADEKLSLRFSDDLVNWSEPITLATHDEYTLLYGCFMHEKFMEDGGKTVYFMMSQYVMAGGLPDGDPYNVRLMKMRFE